MTGLGQARAAAVAVPEQEWRGVAAEHRDDDLTAHSSAMLKARSRRLLTDLIRPHKALLKVLLAVVLVENAARLSIPFLVKEGIDRGIPPIQATGDTSTLWTIVALVFGATLVQAVSRRTFLASRPDRPGNVRLTACTSVSTNTTETITTRS